jgi:hypothetical protein
VTTIARWTGKQAPELRHALRLSVRGSARYPGVAARTVATWDAQGQRIVPRPEMQAALDTALEHASPSARQRFQAGVATLSTDRDQAGSSADSRRGPGLDTGALMLLLRPTTRSTN